MADDKVMRTMKPIDKVMRTMEPLPPVVDHSKPPLHDPAVVDQLNRNAGIQ